MTLFKKIVSTTAVSICLSSGAFAQDTATSETVVATIDGVDITLGHIIVLAQRLPAQYSEVPAAQLYQGILDQMIQQSVLGKTIAVDEKVLKLTSENEARAFAATEAIEKIGSDAVTPEKVEMAYGAFVANTPPTPEFHASHILVETEDEAKEIIEMVNGGKDFAETAREKSTGPSGPSGGELGWFGRGAMVPEFDQAVADMEVAAVSEPVQTKFGWHVIKLNDKRDHLPLEEMRVDLSEQIREEAISAEIARLESESEITIIEPTFDLNLIRDGSLIK